MIETTLNSWRVRLIIGILLGIPLAMLAYLFGVQSLMFTAYGIAGMEFLLLVAAASTILGFAGICGVWARLLFSSNKMTEKVRRTVRFLLWCGVVSSSGLAVWTLFGELSGTPIVSFLLGMLALTEYAFIKATPKIL